MSFPFQGTYGLIHVDAVLVGPDATASVRLIFDTGSTDTVISSKIAKRIGFDLEAATQTTQLVTASDIVSAPMVVLAELHALGHSMKNCSVLIYDLPGDQLVEGVLGLNFLRRMRLTIDFHREQIWLRYGTLPLEE